MSNEFSLRMLNKVIKRLKLMPNTVLVIEKGCALDAPEILNGLALAIERTNVENVIIVTTGDLDDIKALQEPEMNRLGWWRIETLQKKILRKRSTDEGS